MLHSAVMYLLLVGDVQGSDSRNRVDLDLVIGADLGFLQLLACGHCHTERSKQQPSRTPEGGAEITGASMNTSKAAARAGAQAEGAKESQECLLLLLWVILDLWLVHSWLFRAGELVPEECHADRGKKEAETSTQSSSQVICAGVDASKAAARARTESSSAKVCAWENGA